MLGNPTGETLACSSGLGQWEQLAKPAAHLGAHATSLRASPELGKKGHGQAIKAVILSLWQSFLHALIHTGVHLLTLPPEGRETLSAAPANTLVLLGRGAPRIVCLGLSVKASWRRMHLNYAWKD